MKLHVYMTVRDSGKGAVPLTFVGTANTWAETHPLRAKAHSEGHGPKGEGVTVRVYDSVGNLLLVQAQRGTL